MIRASLDKRPREVASMFDDVAARYDLTNDVLSLGQDRRWRRAVREAVAAQPGERVLDIAAGTGTSSEPFADAGVDVVAGRLLARHAAGRASGAAPTWPSPRPTRCACRSPTTSFDAVTMSFGLRNVADPDAALREFLRVTRPGGRLVVCEFSQPTNAAFRKVYAEYLMRALPPVARRVSSNPDSYVYLAESIQAWPDQRELASRGRGRRLGRRGVAQPHRRDRRPAPRRQGRLSRRTGPRPGDRAQSVDAPPRRGVVELGTPW